LWVQAEIIAIATDLAEFVGAAIALNLLFGVPPFTAGLMTAVVAFAILALQTRGYRRFELAIAALLGSCCSASSTTCCRSASTAARSRRPDPGFDGTDAILLAVGILGATVMPHVVYLHSALTQAASSRERRREARAAALPARRRADRDGPRGRDQPDDADRRRQLFHDSGHTASTRSRAPTPGSSTLLGGGAALAFAVALLASGLSSSSVGTFAGQVVMQGFINRRIPLFLRRAITMAPALSCSRSASTRPTTLVLSQVVLSFGIPFALVPMILLTRRADLMGALVNRKHTTVIASIVAAMIIGLNIFLLWETFT
jgi:manganese transport protein